MPASSEAGRPGDNPTVPKPQMGTPKPDIAPPKSPAHFDDRWPMAAGSLAFGLAIPWLTGLYGPLGPRDAVFWVGFAGFIALAFAIWGGNRWLLFKQREHFDWFNHPLRKLLMLVVANVLYTDRKSVV